jgi:isoleucyl-tRNA synthetase
MNNQREQFKRLGIFADWENPYLTLQPEYEAAQLRVFGEMVAKNYIYRGLKPVYWCTDCETALAEAEIEYADHDVDSIYVKFPVVGGGVPDAPWKDASFVIWTTTTWTLPANVAIAVHKDFDYALVEAGDEKLIIAKDLGDNVMSTSSIENYEILAEFKGSELERIECGHPFLDRNSLVINADLVTLETGTGCVHIAPGHGAEDYFACQAYPEIPIVVPIDGKGVLTDEAGPFSGHYYEKANKTIKDYLEQNEYLLASEQMVHSYPHCWRCKEPIIFRAAEQWFCSIDSFKQQALDEIKKVNWIPKWGEDRIVNMVADRADWCISRQRLWGMPIPVFYCEQTGEPVLDQNVINHVADIFEKEGSNAWFEKDDKDLLPAGYTCENGCSQFRKETDTMDVWFDSGTSHSGVVENRFDKGTIADLYLEGNDQYRGWFQSSLLTSVAHSGKAPYKEVLTHGFIMDEEKRKMSKSMGNGISPNDIINQYGADILRLWVASSDYKSDIKISLDMFRQLSEIYRKIRNTARYILGNIHDFYEPVSKDDMLEIDRFALNRLNRLIEKVKKSYDGYDFHIIYHAIHNFCAIDMSSFYLDIIKDRLYTEKSDSLARRSAQTAMLEILEKLTILIAPILVFTAEEIWSFLPHHKESVHLEEFPEVDSALFDDKFEEKWEKIIEIREEVQKQVENIRADKTIGNSLEAKVIIKATGKTYEFLKAIECELPMLFIISEVEILEGEFEITASKTQGHKCPRCWNYHKNTNELCLRCENVLANVEV